MCLIHSCHSYRAVVRHDHTVLHVWHHRGNVPESVSEGFAEGISEVFSEGVSEGLPEAVSEDFNGPCQGPYHYRVLTPIGICLK